VPDPVEIPALEGRRVLLVPLSPAHSAGMYEMWRCPEVCAHSGPALDRYGRAIPMPVRSPADSDRLLDFWLDRATAGTGFRWAVLEGEGASFAGTIGFNALGACAEYAYHFVPVFWGQGLAAEASRLALAWVFEAGAARVEAFIAPGNLRSVRLIERLGFAEQPVEGGGVPRFVRDADDVAGRV